MNKSKKSSFSLRTTTILCVLIFALSSFLLYCLCDDSKARVLSCQGNYFYSDKQIYEQAHLSLNTRLWLIPSGIMEKEISNLPLVDSVNVKKDENRLVIQVKEKDLIGYYIEDDQYYILTVDNESIELDKEFKSNLIHLPLISDLSKSQRKALCEALKKDEENISHEVIEKISQIVPFSSSYDKNMVRLIMRDGNSVYSSMDSLSMISKYSLVLTQLKGASACLLLDSQHNAIDKINCSDITTNRKELEEQIRACQEDGGTWSEEDKTCTYEQEQIQEQEQSQLIVDDTLNQNTGSDLDAINDWVYDENSGWYYSYSTGYYLSPYTGQYFMWDSESASLVEVQ
ncbi:MAG: FtsQ-type POTRA domain-containing protein [Erysipelotrichaceae bacterium]|uniref:FtsQ-type POTRA domain-containing protein n=1 Tax=Floccifex sp. TaxID=2815810 RepID=UPI002A75F459|nr:FtsQ-type POTRA domain-containing protein [Floccifex sp.]MDD7281940.1 FtsQ-type POTRA domain-containing protein [Erysipelotrichaceae bacterium]MDY2958402.1 FtsQ-type POTRA domain-containing protein [Floccifex sp.]